MFPSVILPLLVAIALAVAVTTIHRRLPPIVAARAVAVTVIVVAAAAAPTLWIVGLGYIAHAPFLGSRLRWCVEVFGVHDRQGCVAMACRSACRLVRDTSRGSAVR